MNIARLLFPVKVLGPGNRLGIWTCGCHHHCPGCSNPELWAQRPEYEVDTSSLMSLISGIFQEEIIDGITITGGDPFDQCDALADLLPLLKEITGDILVYTGYSFNSLKQDTRQTIQKCLKYISVLIDGEYIESLNNGAPLRGSSNQSIIILDKSLEEKYHTFLLSNPDNMIQNFSTRDGLISVGIHRPGFVSDLKEIAKKRGLTVDV